MFRGFLRIFGLIVLIALVSGVILFFRKYHVSDVMVIPVEEVSTAEYPEDPSHRSLYYDRYSGRTLRLAKTDDTHFDFIFESDNPEVATVRFKAVDMKLFIPVQPRWTQDDAGLTVISLTDREWNRQQVKFPRESNHLEVTGGNGFETANLYSAELARNCLNAGLWEVLLYTVENDQKSLYYQGWFTFPMGHYKHLFEELNDRSYWKFWHRLEHWRDPAGTKIALEKLRVVESETAVKPLPVDDTLILAGEQARKLRTLDAKDVKCWGDFCEKKHQVRFAAFVPPGRYDVSTPWNNEFNRIDKLKHIVHRKVRSPAVDRPLDELELVFENGVTGEQCRFLASGLDIGALPQLPTNRYHKGLYMPMGIGVPPFFQSYAALQQNPPFDSPYFSVLLDEQGKWMNHHQVAVDGPVMHRDENDPSLVHLYLLSYERHTLVGHYLFSVE